MGAVLDATNAAIDQAQTAGQLRGADVGALAALRAVAQKIDVQDEYFRALERDAVDHHLRPPSMDNVSLPTYLKFCESLGLTPAGRVRTKFEEPKQDAGGTLSKLRLAHTRPA